MYSVCDAHALLFLCFTFSGIKAKKNPEPELFRHMQYIYCIYRTHTHTRMHIYIYIYIYACVCVRVYFQAMPGGCGAMASEIA